MGEKKLPVLTYNEHKALFSGMNEAQIEALANFKMYEMESYFYTYSFLKETNWVFRDIKVDPWYDRRGTHPGENLFCDCGRRVKYLYILESKRPRKGKILVKKLGITHFELEAGIPPKIIQEIRKGLNRIDRYQDSILIDYRNGKRFDKELFEKAVSARAFDENKHATLYKKCLAFKKADLPLFVNDEEHLRKVYRKAIDTLTRKQEEYDKEQRRRKWELQQLKNQEKSNSLKETRKRIETLERKMQEEQPDTLNQQVYKRASYLKLIENLSNKKKRHIADVIERRWRLSQKRISRIFEKEGYQLIGIDVGNEGCHITGNMCTCGQPYQWGVILQKEGKQTYFNVYHLEKHHVLNKEDAETVEKCFRRMQRDLYEVCEYTLKYPQYWSKRFTKVIDDPKYISQESSQYKYLTFLRANGYAAPKAFNKRLVEWYRLDRKNKTPLAYKKVINYFREYSKEPFWIDAVNDCLNDHPEIKHQQDVRAVWLIRLIEIMHIDRHEEFAKIKEDAILRAFPYKTVSIPMKEIRANARNIKKLKKQEALRMREIEKARLNTKKKIKHHRNKGMRNNAFTTF